MSTSMKFNVNDIFAIQEKDGRVDGYVKMVILTNGNDKYIIVVAYGKVYSFSENLDMDIGKVFQGNNFRMHYYEKEPDGSLEKSIGNKNHQRNYDLVPHAYKLNESKLTITNKNNIKSFNLNKETIINMFINSAVDGQFRLLEGVRNLLKFVVKLNVSNYVFDDEKGIDDIIDNKSYAYLYSQFVSFKYLCDESAITLNIGEQINLSNIANANYKTNDNNITDISNMSIKQIGNLIQTLTKENNRLSLENEQLKKEIDQFK